MPVRNASQRRLLDEARCLTGRGALIQTDRNYRQQLKVYENQTRAAGLYRMHGLRHGFAQLRYEEITGWKSPAAGGPARRTLTAARRRVGTAARRTIAHELGHDRISVVAQYIGGGRTKVATAVARELLGFVWAVVKEIVAAGSDRGRRWNGSRPDAEERVEP